MIEISFDYWNKLASETVFMSSLLGGFSITVIANLLVAETNTRMFRNIMRLATIAACSFLIGIFAWTNVMMKTTVDYPMAVSQADLIMPRIIGAFSMLIGIVALITMVAMAGWTKSKGMGWFTTIIGLLTGILILVIGFI